MMNPVSKGAVPRNSSTAQLGGPPRGLSCSHDRCIDCGDEAETYAFRFSDFDRSYGWYDFLGANPYGTTGTLSYSRPDGGQVSVTFRADQRTPGADCAFSGSARFVP